MHKLRRLLRPFRPLRRAALRGAIGFRRRPRAATVALTLLLLVGVIAGGSFLLIRSQQPVAVSPATEPTFTFRDGWSLVELQRHVEAGEVEAITAVKATSASGQPIENLLVRTSGGQVVPIDLSVTAGEAVSALTALGYGDLLTSEALQVTRPAVSETPPNLLAIVLPMTMLGLTIFLVFRLSRRNNPGQRDSSTFKTIMPAAPVADGDLPLPADPTLSATVRLDDVAGCDEAKLELTETIEFLRTPERFHKLGARIPRGIMLYGPPGTGKTMLARAVAAEAGVPFHHASGSEFVEKYVGVGAKRIRDLFAQARKLGRGVIFFDEFDALGKARGGPNSHEEREQTLNQLLVELDGFGTTDDVIVIAATNRIDTLDSAVLRPGRFNRKIHVGLPDVKGRKEILAVHARNKPLAEAVDLEETARKTYGFSGAMLADLLNESAILAARRSSETIDPEDLHGGWLKVAVGTSRRRSMDERERSIIAAHEVGHAICGKVHGDKRKVEEISLFAHGEALGVTVSSQEDNDLPSESDLRARLIALMGGRAAEELLFQEVTGGAANDFEAANKIATAMVTRWGMGRDPEASDTGISGRGTLSFLVPAPGGRSLPSDVQAAATRAIRSILDSAYADACRTLIDNMDTLRRLAAYLVEHERVDGETFDELFDGRRPVPNGSDEWRAATARPRAWGEIVDLAAHRIRTVPVIVAAALTGAAPSPEPAVAATVTPEVPTAAPELASLASAADLAARQASGRTRRRGQSGRRVAIGLGSLPSRRLRLATANALHRAAGWLRSTEPEGDQL
jgi:cell division protease FtsH